MLPVALLLATTSAHAAVNVEVKDAYKAMLQINTYNGQGQLLKSGPAFFINSQGDAVAAYNLLKGAQRAEVIDYKGKKYSVFRILGANSNADLVKFSIKGVNKNEYFSLTSTTATQGAALTLLHYTQNKKEVMPQITITNAVAYAPIVITTSVPPTIASTSTAHSLIIKAYLQRWFSATQERMLHTLVPLTLVLSTT